MNDCEFIVCVTTFYHEGCDVWRKAQSSTLVSLGSFLITADHLDIKYVYTTWI